MESASIVNLVQRLKVRSGNSEKLVIKDLINLEEQNSFLCFVLMTNSDAKLSILMKQTDVLKHSLEVGKNVTVKNLENVKNVKNIPIFKAVKTSNFRESRIRLENELEFETDEVAAIRSIDIAEFGIEEVDVTERAGPSGEDVRFNKDVLTLSEFFLVDPKKLRNDQYVEMIVLGGQLAGSKKMFSGALYKIIVASRDGSFMNVMLTYLDLIGHLTQIENDERLQRFMSIRVKASELRSKANLPYGSTTNQAAKGAVERHRKIAKTLFSMKYPGLDMKEENYRATCALELKYEKFNEEDIVVKTNKLGNEEIGTLLTSMRSFAKNHQENPKSGAFLLLQIESCPYEEMGEYNGIAFIPSPDDIIEGKFYMQPEVIKEFSIPITAGDVYVGLVRSVDKNPQMLYDGSTVIRMDWLEACDDSAVENFLLLAATESNKRKSVDEKDSSKKKPKL